MIIDCSGDVNEPEVFLPEHIFCLLTTEKEYVQCVVCTEAEETVEH